MRYVRVLFIGAMIAAIAFGCGPAKELPDEVPQVKKTTGIPPDPHGKAPEASEPEAKAIVDRAVKAITQNRIEVQAKARICRVVANGKMKPLNSQEMTETVRTVFSVWPDRVLTTYDFKEGAYPRITFGLNSPIGWLLVGKGPYIPGPDLAENGQIITIDIMAQHWIPLSLALTYHNAIFFAAQKNTPKAGATSIKFRMKDLPIYLVAFDDKSGLPLGVDYYPFEQGARVHKVIKFSDHKDMAGLMLPTSIQMNQNDRDTEQWIVDLWEFPDRFDDKSFDLPK
jgi:hypothetical protein